MIRACPGCGRPFNRPQAKRCLDCAYRRRLDLNRAARHRTIADGECQRCGSGRGEDGTAHHCRPCADAANRVRAARRTRLIEAGRCGVCGYLPKPGQHKCERCAGVVAKAQKARWTVRQSLLQSLRAERAEVEAVLGRQVAAGEMARAVVAELR